MGSTIDAAEFQAALDEFETTFGLTYEEFAALETDAQNEILYAKADEVESADVYSLIDEIYSYYASLVSVYEDMQANGTALEAAQASVYLSDEEFQAEYELSLNLSSMWGEQISKSETDTQETNGSDASYTVEDPYAGQEVTIDLSTSAADDDLWVSDPNAEDPNMCDTDGDGYKDTTFYSSSRTEYNVTNTDGNVVNIDTDGDGDIDKYDGLNANSADLPVCEIDLNGGSWELVDYDPETDYYRIKVTSGEEPDLIESYINVYGPCYIVPSNGTAPSETTLRTYSEEAMRFFKQTADAETTVGELLYGAEAGSENITYFLDSSNLANAATIDPTDEQFEAGATITVELEADERDDITINCQNADASFSWEGDDLHMTLTNDAGETVTYIFKNFQTDYTADGSDTSDALHLSNVDISDEEMLNLMCMSPGDADGDNYTDYEGGVGAAYSMYSVASCIYLTDEAGSDGDDYYNSVYGVYVGAVDPEETLEDGTSV